MADNSLVNSSEIQRLQNELVYLQKLNDDQKTSINSAIKRKADLIVNHQKIRLDRGAWKSDVKDGKPRRFIHVTFKHPFHDIPHVSVTIEGSHPGLVAHVENVGTSGCTVIVSYTVKAASFDPKKTNHKISIASIGV